MPIYNQCHFHISEIGKSFSCNVLLVKHGLVTTEYIGTVASC